MSWCKKNPAVLNVKLAITHLLERWFLFPCERPEESDNHEGQEDILNLSAVTVFKRMKSISFCLELDA